MFFVQSWYSKLFFRSVAPCTYPIFLVSPAMHFCRSWPLSEEQGTPLCLLISFIRVPIALFHTAVSLTSLPPKMSVVHSRYFIQFLAPACCPRATRYKLSMLVAFSFTASLLWRQWTVPFLGTSYHSSPFLGTLYHSSCAIHVYPVLFYTLGLAHLRIYVLHPYWRLCPLRHC